MASGSEQTGLSAGPSALHVAEIAVALNVEAGRPELWTATMTARIGHENSHVPPRADGAAEVLVHAVEYHDDRMVEKALVEAAVLKRG